MFNYTEYLVYDVETHLINKEVNKNIIVNPPKLLKGGFLGLISSTKSPAKRISSLNFHISLLSVSDTKTELFFFVEKWLRLKTCQRKGSMR